MSVLELADGRLVKLGESTVGGSKNDTRFGQIGSQPVVVKLEGPHGRLAVEEQALRFMARHGVAVPAVVGSGVTADGHRFLVISRETGARPTTPAGWEKLGRDLAALLDVPVSGCPLARVTTAQFVSEHRNRLRHVRPLLSAGVAEEISRAIDEVSDGDRPVATHGDPGGGNYLERPTGAGILLDWETASVSPVGLDLGRAAFIGLLDLRRTGIPDRLVTAFVHGYAGRSPLAAQVALTRSRAWITIAGLQFIHDRHTRPLRRERTSQIAAEVLAAYIAAAS